MLGTIRLWNARENHSQCMPSMVGPGETLLLLWGSPTPDRELGYLWKSAHRSLGGTDSAPLGGAWTKVVATKTAAAIRPKQA